jgi:Domain of unknown function (DUF1990)
MAQQELPPAVPGEREEERRPDQTAGDGSGPLLQRDYVLVLEGSHCSPEEVVQKLRRDFPRYAPEALVEFSRPSGSTGPMQVNDTMHVVLRGAGQMGVRVTHADERTFTMQTLEGHQEAGHITFGAYYDEGGRLVCRIRSRTRQGNPLRLLAYELLGVHAQKAIWAGFLERLAQDCGGRQLGEVVTSTDPVPELPVDRGEAHAPTFTPP